MKKIFAKDYVFDGTVIEDYYSAVESLFEKMGLDKNGYPINYAYAEVYVLNVCLFCEICMKSMVLLRGHDVECNHNLMVLFNELSPADQYYIASETISNYIGPSMDYVLEFKKYLDKEKNNFCEFRYVMFPGNDKYTNCSFLKLLAVVLKNKTLSLCDESAKK